MVEWDTLIQNQLLNCHFTEFLDLIYNTEIQK